MTEKKLPKALHAANVPKHAIVHFLMGINDWEMVRVTNVSSDGQIQYQYNGNVGFDRHWRQIPRENRRTLFLWQGQMPADIPHVVVNCVCDPDCMLNALQLAQSYVTQIGQRQNIAVINPPDRILQTQRQSIYQLFSRLPGIMIPGQHRLRPKRVQDIIDFVEKNSIRLPILVRPVGSQSGRELLRIDDLKRDRDLLEQYAYDGATFYLSEFVDFAGSDGLYRKLRIIVIDGVPFARHLIVAPGWQIHAESRYDIMSESVGLRNEEELFLDSFPAGLSAAALESLVKIHQTLGLDYFGIDCNVRSDGSLLVFEINAAMKGFEQQRLDENPYLERHVSRLRQAFERMVIERAGQVMDTLHVF